MTTVIDGSGASSFATPLPVGQGGTGSTTALAAALALLGAQSVATRGYAWVGGILIQWGQESLTANGQTYSFPLTFPIGAFTLVAMQVNGGGPGLTTNNITSGNIVNTSQFTIACNIAGTINWVAIGR